MRIFKKFILLKKIYVPYTICSRCFNIVLCNNWTYNKPWIIIITTFLTIYVTVSSAFLEYHEKKFISLGWRHSFRGNKNLLRKKFFLFVYKVLEDHILCNLPLASNHHSTCLSLSTHEYSSPSDSDKQRTSKSSQIVFLDLSWWK